MPSKPLLVLLALTVAASVLSLTRRADEDLVEAVAPAGPAAAPSPVPKPARSTSQAGLDLTRLPPDAPLGDIFETAQALEAKPAPVKTALKSAPPTPAAIAPMPVPAPQAPSLPFRYIGQLTDAQVTTVFLAAPSDNLAVRLGETVLGSYRLDALSPTELTFTYLPLKQQQKLPLRNDF